MKAQTKIERLDWLLVIFAIVYALLIIAPALLSQEFMLMPLMTQGDALDLIAPLILVPGYWLLLKTGAKPAPSQKEILIFLLFVIIWVEGHGMHLASNSIARLAKEIPDGQTAILTNFYDEKLSHYLWHIGLFGLSGTVIYRQWQNPTADSSPWGYEVLGGIIHGVTCFIDVVESATVYLSFPWLLAIVLFGLFKGKKPWQRQPMLRFFWTAYLLAILLLLAWGIYWGGFPEFSQLGIID
ncbi:MAG: hypothetical protein AAFO95_05860 [Cyanobacteria bacterium J06600_6]